MSLKLTQDQEKYTLQQKIKIINKYRILKNKTKDQEKEYFNALESFNPLFNKTLCLLKLKTNKDNLQECKINMLESLINNIYSIDLIEERLKKHFAKNKKRLKTKDLSDLNDEIIYSKYIKEKISKSLLEANLTQQQKEYIILRTKYNMNEICHKISEREQDKLIKIIRSKIN